MSMMSPLHLIETHSLDSRTSLRPRFENDCPKSYLCERDRSKTPRSRLGSPFDVESFDHQVFPAELNVLVKELCKKRYVSHC